jgi:hypothetical protein
MCVRYCPGYSSQWIGEVEHNPRMWFMQMLGVQLGISFLAAGHCCIPGCPPLPGRCICLPHRCLLSSTLDSCITPHSQPLLQHFRNLSAFIYHSSYHEGALVEQLPGAPRPQSSFWIRLRCRSGVAMANSDDSRAEPRGEAVDEANKRASSSESIARTPQSPSPRSTLFTVAAISRRRPM